MTASYITRTYSHEQRCSSLGLFSLGVLRKAVLGEEQDALSSVESVCFAGSLETSSTCRLSFPHLAP